MSTPAERTFSIGYAADSLGVSSRTIERRLARGELTALRVNGERRILSSSIESARAKRATPVVPPPGLPDQIPQGLEHGRVRDLLHLTPEDYQIADIALRLAKINRYCGAMRWPLSVATHSVLVSYLCPAGFERAGLLHDITETFGIGDVIAPIKRVIPDVAALEDAIRDQLIPVFPELALHNSPEVKHADERAYQLEVWCIRGREPNPEHTAFGFVHPRKGCTTEEGDLYALCARFLQQEIDWRESARLFVTRYTELFT